MLVAVKWVRKLLVIPPCYSSDPHPWPTQTTYCAHPPPVTIPRSHRSIVDMQFLTIHL